MRINEVSIKNVRGISALKLKLDRRPSKGSPASALSPSGEWLVVAGRNGSGKTTLLRSIAAVFMGADVLPRMQIENWQWISSGATESKVTLRIAESVDDNLPAGDHPAPVDPPSGPNETEPMRFGLRWAPDSTFLELPHKRNHNFVYSRIWAFSPGERLHGWMILGLGASRTRAPSTTLAEDWLKGPPRRASLVTLFRTDATLRFSLDWVLKTTGGSGDPLSTLERVVEPLLASVGALIFNEPTAAKVDSKGIHLNRRGSWVRIEDCGLGAESLCLTTLEILHRMFDFFGPTFLRDALPGTKDGPDWLQGPMIPRSGVVLIDEAENHLHPRLQQRLGPWLRRRFPNIQFIVTTHSPYIAQGADRLFVIGGDAAIEELSGAELDRVVNGSVDDAVTSRLFGLDNPYSLHAQEMRKRLGEIERSMQRGEATPAEVAERRKLLDHLPSAADYEVAQALRQLREEEE